MKVTRRHLKSLILEELDRLESRLLSEQEDDPFGGGEDEAAEEGGEDEAADEGAEEEAEEEEAEEEGAEEGEEESGEAAMDLTPGDEIALGKSVDNELEALMIDYESEALKSAQLQGSTAAEFDEVVQNMKQEWYRKPLGDLLFEQDEAAGSYSGPAIDMEKFTGDVARLVMNYQSLLDMEALIINKAKSFLRAKYDQEHVDKFEEILDVRFGVTIGAEERESEVPESPAAIGAMPSGA